MWSNPAIDSLLNPEYSQVSDYRKLFRLIGYKICLDVGTRTEDGDGEAHILLISHEGSWGILVVHDQYAKGLPPQFCVPHPKFISRFQKQLDKEIIWFDEPSDIPEWVQQGGTSGTGFGIIAKKSPLIAGFFFRDMLEFFKEEGVFSLTS
jgi:hypothetical protein